MKKSLTLLSILFINQLAISQSIVFTQCYNGTFGSGQFIHAFICDTTTSGNYLMVGGQATMGFSQYLYGVIDRQGAVLWQKDSAIIDTSNGMHSASFNNGKRTLDNGYVFTGAVTNFSMSNTEGIFILKTDSIGNEVWRKNISNYQQGGAEGIYLSEDSSILISGYIKNSTLNSYHPYILKLSSLGDSIFMNEFAINCSNSPSIFYINDKYYICGETYNIDTVTQQVKHGYFILTTDTDGNYLNLKVVIDSLFTRYIGNFTKTIDDKLILTYTERDTSGSGFVQVVMMDTLATVIWQETLVNQPYMTSAVCQLPNGEIITSYQNNKVRKFDLLGNTLWMHDLAAPPSHSYSSFQSNSIFPINNSTFIISSTESVSSPGAAWLTLTEIMDTSLTIILETDKVPFSIYPNPTSNTFTLAPFSSMNKILIQIINYQGSIVHIEELTGSTEYKVHHRLSSGMYFIRLFDGKNSFVRKLIVQ